MGHKRVNLVIMFADVVGSTQLYETLGDAKAQAGISACISTMSDLITNSGGNGIRIIGDEIMCRFRNADKAVDTAIAIHSQLADEDTQFAGLNLTMRIGIHYGPVILKDGEIYGDTVNTAARIASIAKGDQILTTEQTVKQLSPLVRQTSRQFDCATVKGKREELKIYEVLWGQDNVTRVATTLVTKQPKSASKLRLQYQGRYEEITAASPAFTVGRDGNCDMVVQTHLASRIHGRLEYRRGKFVFIDQSTNGTFVTTPDGHEVYLRREELPLSGTGFISLGCSRSNGKTIDVINFVCQ